MSQEKYIGMDVHQATISVAVMEAHGKLIMECLLETKAATIVEFIQGLQGTLWLTFEEGTSAAWFSRKNLGLRSRRSFFLDIPFYRTHLGGSRCGIPERLIVTIL
jgi:hypothetical protein